MQKSCNLRTKKKLLLLNLFHNNNNNLITLKKSIQVIFKADKDKDIL
jgi:hypothetical protein